MAISACFKNDQNVALTNMAKSANDNIMTIAERVFSSPLTPSAYCHGLSDESLQCGPEAKAPVGGLDWGRSP